MKSMEVLLREDIDKLGRCGDVVRVAPGYARNFLMPRNLATAATPENKALMERRRAKLEIEAAERNKEYAAQVELLNAVRLSTAERADDQGHLYGSVNTARVVELLAGAGHTVDERQVRLEAPIKAVGEHAVPIHVHGEFEAAVTLVVEAAATQ